MKGNSTGDMPMIEMAIQALGSTDWLVREGAKGTLIAIGSAAVEPLIKAMETQTGRVCWEAATALSQIDDPRWVVPMTRVISSKNPLLGQTAINALERRGVDMVDVFIDSLPRSHHFVQVHLVTALEKLGDRRAVRPLMKLLETTDSSELRYTIIQALGVIGDPQAAELIGRFQDDEDHHVRKRVGIALQRLKIITDGDNEVFD